MRLSRDADLNERFPARLAAQALLRNGLDYVAAAKELRPDIKTHQKLIREMKESAQVTHELEKIMDRKDRTAQRYLDVIWDWLEASGDDKFTNERKCTAARILAKGYISEKDHKKEAANNTFHIEGLGDTSALTGDSNPKEKVQ